MVQIYLFSHDDYKNLLNILKIYTKYVEVVIPYGDSPSDPFIMSLQDLLMVRKQVFKWQGTETYGSVPSTLYQFLATEKLFDSLVNMYDNFFYVSNNKLDFHYSSFGDKDIAFYDAENKPIFYATPHEGYSYIREGLINS